MSIRHEVFLSDKDVLAFLLKFLNVGAASFSNKPQDHSFLGEVELPLPVERKLRCGGHTRLNGVTSGNFYDAEQSVANKAISFLEKNYKLSVADMNFAERIDTEIEEKQIRSFKDTYESLGWKAEEKFITLVRMLDNADEFLYDINYINRRHWSEEENRAYDFCSCQREKLLSEVEALYTVSSRKFKALIQREVNI